MREPPIVVAHRGWATRFPENSTPALRGALEAGVEMVEFDVQLSADGVPVVIHDPTLERTAGVPGCVMELSWTQLARATLKMEGPDAGRSTARLSSVTEVGAVLEHFPAATAFVELKRHSVERFGAEHFAERCLAALGPLVGRCVLTSFELPALLACRRLGAQRIAWVLRRYDAASLAQARSLEPDFLFCNYEKLPEADSPLAPGPWSWVLYEVRTAALARALGRRGADYVETMAVGELLAELRRGTAAG